MGKTSYISTHGMIWGEISDAGVTTSYGHDALESVTETFASGAVENTYRYKPYGALLAKTGGGGDPSFLWNGGSGYRATNLTNSGYYARRRHFSSGTALWNTIDPSWPSERPYVYCSDSPTGCSDPSGLVSMGQGPTECCLPYAFILSTMTVIDTTELVSVPCGDRTLNLLLSQWTGLIITITFTQQISNGPGLPCSLIWKEKWTGDTSWRTTFPDGSTFCPVLQATSNQLEPVFEVVDPPGFGWGVFAKNPNAAKGMSYHFNICFNIIFSGICGDNHAAFNEWFKMEAGVNNTGSSNGLPQGTPYANFLDSGPDCDPGMSNWS